jgi:hypothetical protein
LNDELVERFRVDDMRKTRRAEVSAVGADDYVLQVDVRFHRCETDITEPNVGWKKKQISSYEPFVWSETMTKSWPTTAL